MIAERGWVEADQLERAHRRAAAADARAVGGRSPALAEDAETRLRAAIDAAGAARARRRRRSTSGTGRCSHGSRTSPSIAGGRARSDAADPLAGHPFVSALEAAPFTPPAATDVDRAELRQLVQRGLVVEQDGIYFAPSAVELAAGQVARLLVVPARGLHRRGGP